MPQTHKIIQQEPLLMEAGSTRENLKVQA